MENFIKHFHREGDGAWLCVEPAELKKIKGCPG